MLLLETVNGINNILFLCYTQRKTLSVGQRAVEMPGKAKAASAAEDSVLIMNDQYICVYRS